MESASAGATGSLSASASATGSVLLVGLYYSTCTCSRLVPGTLYDTGTVQYMHLRRHTGVTQARTMLLCVVPGAV